MSFRVFDEVRVRAESHWRINPFEDVNKFPESSQRTLISKFATPAKASDSNTA